MTTGKMEIMDITAGDIKFEWDADKKKEVELAEKSFNDAKAKGYLAFRVEDDGKMGSKIEKFDKTAERILMIPPVMGG